MCAYVLQIVYELKLYESYTNVQYLLKCIAFGFVPNGVVSMGSCCLH